MAINDTLKDKIDPADVEKDSPAEDKEVEDTKNPDLRALRAAINELEDIIEELDKDDKLDDDDVNTVIQGRVDIQHLIDNLSDDDDEDSTDDDDISPVVRAFREM
jgi:predicted ribosome quality control (RQC) complex YloA/Tae2 family protein